MRECSQKFGTQFVIREITELSFTELIRPYYLREEEDEYHPDKNISVLFNNFDTFIKYCNATHYCVGLFPLENKLKFDKIQRSPFYDHPFGTTLWAVITDDFDSKKTKDWAQLCDEDFSFEELVKLKQVHTEHFTVI